MEISLPTLQLLNSIFVRSNDDKSTRMTADRAQIIVHEEVSATDRNERALVTEIRIQISSE